MTTLISTLILTTEALVFPVKITTTTTTINTTGTTTTTVTTTTITTAFRITTIFPNLTSLLAMANSILDENEGFLNHPKVASNRTASTGFLDGGSLVKLYVSSIPRTAREGDIRPLFEQHGNVIEVIFIKDKRTGQQQVWGRSVKTGMFILVVAMLEYLIQCGQANMRSIWMSNVKYELAALQITFIEGNGPKIFTFAGSCFVKYATLEEADRAIRALHNQLSLPGGGAPLVVRYADGKHERLGNCHERLGSGFIKFASREMALSAIKALNGTYTMRGCDHPLIVRFADPKKPRIGELRGNSEFHGPGPRPLPQESVARHLLCDAGGSGSIAFAYEMQSRGPPPRFACLLLTHNRRSIHIARDSRRHPKSEKTLFVSIVQLLSNSNFSGPWGGSMVPNALPPVSPSIASSCQFVDQEPPAYGKTVKGDCPILPGNNNSAAPVQLVSGSGSSPSEAVIASVNKLHEPATSSMQQAPLPQQSPSQLSWMEQQTHSSQENFHSSQESLGNQLHQIQPSQENHWEQPKSILPIYQSGATGNKIQTVALPHSVSLPGASSTMSSASGVTTNPLAENCKNCDWSEHICPDGYIYYYNCITCESRWEKPEEFALYEQQLEEEEQQQQPRSPNSENLCHVPESEAHSTKQDSHIEEMQKLRTEPLMAHSPQQKFHKGEDKLQTGLEPHSPRQESPKEEQQKIQSEPSVEHSPQQVSHEEEGQKVLTEPLVEEQKIQTEPLVEHSPHQVFHEEEEQKILTEPTVEHSTQQECHEEMEQKIQTEALIAHSPQQEPHTEEVKFQMELPQQQDLLQNHSLPSMKLPNLYAGEACSWNLSPILFWQTADPVLNRPDPNFVSLLLELVVDNDIHRSMPVEKLNHKETWENEP
ncbi:WW domain [Dillenia turbinata]|uniref:WW domain n=1 Tax=Dillenia turbinata TaxID=194707 RepID=A0AAN8W1C0_9MAGN